MRTYVGDQEVATASEFAELACAFEVESFHEFIEELLFGRPGESSPARAARLQAARDILADLEEESPELAAYAVRLLGPAPLVRRRMLRRQAWLEAAA
ncbi:hypothetical protein [Kitasatospora camelliae]|uniref:CdiI immunity protein domain-containing protein n=1 Tax=Kitasatospora camelliae TaxID=3156397 RepID=A0AAU8JZY3_9ACTN